MEQKTASPLSKGLGGFKRKTVDLASFNPVKESQFAETEPLPLVMEPATDQVDLADWIKNNHSYVEQKMAKHGGILYRGFDLKGARDFERVAAAICDELYAEYGDLPRETLADKVYTSTPYPEDKSILYHNESSHMSSWPGKINFFCITVAQEGGATPVADMRKVYQSLDPQVRDAFEQKGVTYVRNFCEGLDVSWQRFFGTDDQSKVEEECRKSGATCEFLRPDHLRVSQRCRAVLSHPKTGELCFFNQVQLHHTHCLDPETRQALLSMFKPDEMPRQVFYGDGSTISDAVMDHVGEIYEKHAVRFQWKAGDLISLDNMLIAHARDPYKGPRKIVVAMGDMVDGATLAA